MRGKESSGVRGKECSRSSSKERGKEWRGSLGVRGKERRGSLGVRGKGVWELIKSGGGEGKECGSSLRERGCKPSKCEKVIKSEGYGRSSSSEPVYQLVQCRSSHYGHGRTVFNEN